HLSDLLQHHTTTRSLRSADANLLKTIRTKHQTWGDRGFAAAAPSFWNNLPMHIHQANTLSIFKKALKPTSSVILSPIDTPSFIFFPVFLNLAIVFGGFFSLV
ncbi:hypothetical protein LDENG_00119700, partial [Lucifuga dentata]